MILMVIYHGWIRNKIQAPHEGCLLEFQFLQIHRFHLSTAGMDFTGR